MNASGVGIALAGDAGCRSSPCNTRALRTLDGGQHWTDAFNGRLGLSDLSLIDGEAWLVGTSCVEGSGTQCERSLLTSTDGGATWDQRPIPIAGYFVSFSRASKTDAWIASSDAGGNGPEEIKVTHDGGAKWTSLPHPTGEAFASQIFFRSDQHGWLVIGGQPYNSVFQDKWLYGTADGGATWTQLFGRPGDIPGNLGALVFTSNEEGWMATAHGGLSHTIDGGIHWSHVDLDRGQTDPNPVLQFVDDRDGWTTSDDYSSFTGPRKILWATSDGGAMWQKLPLPAPGNA